jgi:peptide/nickel transport system permease protein
MISDGQLVLTTKWWVSTLPGLAVVTTGVGLSLVGDGLADVWRLR